MICRVLVAKDSDSSERVPSGSRGWTHISVQWWAGVIVGLSGCFLLFFQGSPCSSPFADTWALKERGVWRRRPKRPGLEKGESKLAEGWEKPAGRTRQAWESGRLKRMGKKERNKPGKTQTESCCSGKALLGRDPQTPGTTILLLSAMVCKTHWTDIVSPTVWALGGLNNLLLLSTGSHTSGLDGRARGPTWSGQCGQRVL